MKTVLCVLLYVTAAIASGQESGAVRNYYEITKQPAGTLDPDAKSLLDKLAKSRVPAAHDAEQIALQEFIKKGILAQESWQVTGLYRVFPVEKHAAAESDLVWEVRLGHSFNGADGVSGLAWVSCSTGAVRILFR